MARPLANREWLWDLVTRYCEAYDPERARAVLPADSFGSNLPPLPRARLAVRSLMRSSGLRYGMPLRVDLVAASLPTAEALFLTALVRQFDLCGAAALVLNVSLARDARRADLLLFLTALLGERRRIERAAQLRSSPNDESSWHKLARSLSRPLWKRGHALVADPVMGLPLHNGLLYSDSRFLGRLAMDSYRRGYFSPRAAERLRQFGFQQRAALVEALLLLARADRSLGKTARSTILRQLRKLGFPYELRIRLRKSLEHPRSPETIAASIRSPRTRAFVLEQVVLGSLADGWRSPRERLFLQRLAGILGVPDNELASIEAELADFYAAQPDFVDRFWVQDRLANLFDQAMGRLAEIVDRNRAALTYEARQGRELTAALATLARGGKLDFNQRRRLRAQLLDLAKTIPGLAIFAAPGGLLLVLALSKVLPASFLPSILLDPKRRLQEEDERFNPEAKPPLLPGPTEPPNVSDPRRS